MGLENYGGMIDQFDPMKVDQQVETTRQMRNTNRLADVSFGEKQREMAEQKQLNDVYKNALGRDGVLDRTAFQTGVVQGGLGHQLPALQKSFLEQDKLAAEAKEKAAQTGKHTAETKKIDLDAATHQYELAGQLAGAWANDPAVTKDKITKGLNAAFNAKIISPEIYNAKVEELNGTGDDVPSLNGWAKKSVLEITKSKDRLAYLMPDANTQANNETSIKTTGMNNQVSKENTDKTVAQAERSSLRSDARAREAFNEPKYMETDQGIVALPKKLLAGQAPVGTAVTGSDGKILLPKMKDIPASVNTAIVTNMQNLNKAQTALDLLSGKKVGMATGDTAATGWKGYAPNALLNRMDSEGTDTRAAIADLGSMVLHDRSGAAVTAAESPRLMPFIPLATDDAVTAGKKLRRFIDIYQQETNALGETYSKAQGYKPNPILTKAAKPAPIADIHAQADAILGKK
jgi:hypothetical protein